MIFHSAVALGVIGASLLGLRAADAAPPTVGILLIGDSWVSQFATGAKKDAAPGGNWLTASLQDRLGEKTQMMTKNRGVGGTNTFDWRPEGKLLHSAEKAAPPSECPWVFVALGINDSSENYGAFDPETYKFQLGKIVDDLTEHGYRVLLQSPPYIIPQGRNHTDQGVARLNGYRAAITALVAAKRPQIVFDIDSQGAVYQYTLSHPEAIGTDHVHPNAFGRKAVAAIWANNIVSVIAPG